LAYVDAIYLKDSDLVKVVERINGKRVYVDYPAEYMFYYSDQNGKHKTIYGGRVSKFHTRLNLEYQKAKRIHAQKTLWESDFNPIGRCLEKNYLKSESPALNVAFFDIETDFCKRRGFAPPATPFNKVTAISTYLNWEDILITQVIAPGGMSAEEAKEICDKFENTILYTSEIDLLNDFLYFIEDADVLSGWNSETYDIPYLVNRVSKVMSKKDTSRFCLWDKFPRKKEVLRYGAHEESYDLFGRIHLDYMQLYQKFTFHEMHSYSLDAIGEYEIKEKKVAYIGTLDDLYNKDFEKFIEYSRQDTALLHKIDKKLKFISLANSVTHENTVLIPKALGTIAVTEQGIINESHSFGLVVPNKVKVPRGEEVPADKAAGAYVAHPQKGLHKWIGSVDINSLYPSVIRALNMSLETIVGQLRPTATEEYLADKTADKVINGKKKKGCSDAAAWEGLFGTLEYNAVMDKRKDVKITIDWEQKGNFDISCFGKLAGSTKISAAQVYELVFESDQPWFLSANGTIFTMEKTGIIPGLLKRWYAERKEFQATLQDWNDLEDGIEIPERLL